MALCPAVGPDEGKAVAVEPRDGQAGAGAACGCVAEKHTRSLDVGRPCAKRVALDCRSGVEYHGPHLNQGDLQACTRGSRPEFLYALRKLR